MFIGLSLLLMVFTTGFKQYDCAAICFSCTEMLEDEKCQHVTTCQDNEVCFIQKYRTADNRRLYDVGCTHNQLCPLNRTVAAFGKRTVDHSHIMCHECCNGNVCNSAFTCDEHSKPKLLDCLSCGGVVDVHNCSTSTTCDKDEVCFIQKYRTSTNKEFFDLGCKRSTVIHRRYDGSVDFNQIWEKYKQGFGNVTGEYWLGNEAIHLISTNGKHKLYIDLELRNGSRFYADYSLFKLNNESSQYLLNVTGYSGTAGDAMDKGLQFQNYRSNGAVFSTKDRDNAGNNCAFLKNGGWWYVACSISDLNGKYTTYQNGAIWRINGLDKVDIRLSEMMITKY